MAPSTHTGLVRTWASIEQHSTVQNIGSREQYRAWAHSTVHISTEQGHTWHYNIVQNSTDHCPPYVLGTLKTPPIPGRLERNARNSLSAFLNSAQAIARAQRNLFRNMKVWAVQKPSWNQSQGPLQDFKVGLQSGPYLLGLQTWDDKLSNQKMRDYFGIFVYLVLVCTT